MYKTELLTYSPPTGLNYACRWLMLVALILLLQVVGIFSFVGRTLATSSATSTIPSGVRRPRQHPSTILQVRHHQCTNWSGADKAWRQSTSLASFKYVYSTTDDHDSKTTTRLLLLSAIEGTSLDPSYCRRHRCF